MILGKPKPEKKIKKEKKSVRKTSSKNVLKKKAHALLRDIVILRDKHCVCPAPERGHSSILQAGHLIPGTKGGTYFDLWNVNLQCSACNGRHVRFEKYYTGWFVFEFGESEYLRLSSDADNLGLKPREIEYIIPQLIDIKSKLIENPDWKPRFTQQEILSGEWKTK